MIHLDLRDVSRFASFKSAEFGTFAEAARVLLARFHAVPPPRPKGGWEHEGSAHDVELSWKAPSHDDQLAHANDIDATEDAGYAFAMAVTAALGFRIVARVHHGSGADWIMVPQGEPQNDYYKLEVSGILKVSSTNTPQARLAQKVAQGSGGDYKRPGIAVVTRVEDVTILSESWR